MNAGRSRDGSVTRRFWAVLPVPAVMAIALALSPYVSAITHGTVDKVHTYAGAWIVQLDDGSYTWCSGSLVSSSVFLSAGHCAVFFFDLFGVPITRMWVSLATNIMEGQKSWRAVSSVLVPPELTLTAFGGAGDAHDIALVVLEKPARNVAPARVAPAGYLDALYATGALAGATFSIVGYGNDESGQPSVERKIATVGFLSLQQFWLATSQKPQLGFGGAASGDSGGPLLYNDGTSEYIVSTVNWVGGDDSVGFSYRVETPGALEFIRRGIAANP